MYGDQSGEFVCGYQGWIQKVQKGEGDTCLLYKVEPQFNEPLHTKDLDITMIFFSRPKL